MDSNVQRGQAGGAANFFSRVSAGEGGTRRDAGRQRNPAWTILKGKEQVLRYALFWRSASRGVHLNRRPIRPPSVTP